MKLTEEEKKQYINTAILEASKHLIPVFVLAELKDGISGIVHEPTYGTFAVNFRPALKDEGLVQPVYNPRSYAIEFGKWYNKNRSFIELNKMDMNSAMKEFEVRSASNLSDPENGSRTEG